MDDLKVENSIKVEEESSSTGLQDLYKAACNENYDAETESGVSYETMTIKPLSYLSQHSYVESGQNSSNGTFETADSVLDLDKGIPIQIINKDMSSYTGDSDLLQRFLFENSLAKQEPSTSYVTIVDMTEPEKLGQHIYIENKKNLVTLGQNNSNIDDCDFNSSDSFASTESIIPKNIKCPKCPKKFMFKSDLLRHDKHKHKKKILSCSFCHKEFTCREKLVFHETSRSCPEVICHLCNKTFQRPVMLTRHINQCHKASALHKCPKCDNSFPIADDLKDHISKSHPEVGYYPCKVCKKIFLVKRSLQVHMKKHCIGSLCRMCHESFDDRMALSEHFKTHAEMISSDTTIEKPFKCEYCPKTYVNRYSYKHHLLKHTTPKTCKFCSEEFENDTELQAHIRLHTFECNICSRKFSTPVTLNRHFKRKHNNVQDQEAFTQTEEEMFQVQNVNIVMDPSLGSSESFLLATPINNIGSLPIFISQPLNVPFSVSPKES